jgi:hypothetical protein
MTLTVQVGAVAARATAAIPKRSPRTYGIGDQEHSNFNQTYCSSLVAQPTCTGDEMYPMVTEVTDCSKSSGQLVMVHVPETVPKMSSY